jgi:hypothetical protein
MPIVTLLDKLNSGQITQEEYEKRSKAVAVKRAWKASNGNGATGVKSANKTERMIRISEKDLLCWSEDLAAVQAAISEGKANAHDAAAVGRIATELLSQVNPLKAQLPALEMQKADLEIEIAEVTLFLAKADRVHVAARRQHGPESDEAIKAGAVVKEYNDKRDALQKTYVQVKGEWFKASR